MCMAPSAASFANVAALIVVTCANAPVAVQTVFGTETDDVCGSEIVFDVLVGIFVVDITATAEVVVVALFLSFMSLWQRARSQR